MTAAAVKTYKGVPDKAQDIEKRYGFYIGCAGIQQCRLRCSGKKGYTGIGAYIH